jgi:hypothetical protein
MADDAIYRLAHRDAYNASFAARKTQKVNSVAAQSADCEPTIRIVPRCGTSLTNCNFGFLSRGLRPFLLAVARESPADLSTSAIGSGSGRLQAQPIVRLPSGFRGALMRHALAPKISKLVLRYWMDNTPIIASE